MIDWKSQGGKERYGEMLKQWIAEPQPEQPVILVHPYYGRRNLSPSTDPFSIPNYGNDQYTQRLANLIHSHRGKIILLEELVQMQGTLVLANAIRGNVHGIEPVFTRKDTPLGVDCTWNPFWQAVNPLSGKELALAGGYLNCDSDSSGCLGAVAKQLFGRDYQFKFIQGLVFTSDKVSSS